MRTHWKAIVRRRSARRFIGLLNGVLMALALLSTSVQAQPAAFSATFEPGDCPVEIPADAGPFRCGTITVPENHDIPDGRTRRLSVTILEALTDTPAPDPILFLIGGPGLPASRTATSAAAAPIWDRFRQQRDIIFFDRRGTLYSEPAFCPELDVAMAQLSYAGLPVVEKQRRELEAFRQCRDAMAARGVDLTQYHSEASAQDMELLRQALGLAQWNLYGVSYGTRLALVAMRLAPKGIRSAVLESAWPTNVPNGNDLARFSHSLGRLFDQCRAQPACEEAFPSFEDDLYATLADYAAQPLELQMADTERFPGGRLVINGDCCPTASSSGSTTGALPPCCQA